MQNDYQVLGGAGWRNSKILVNGNKVVDRTVCSVITYRRIRLTTTYCTQWYMDFWNVSNSTVFPPRVKEMDFRTLESVTD